MVAWPEKAYEWLPDYLTSGKIPNISIASPPLISSATSSPPRDPTENEDCLFLDVIVPKTILDRVGKGDPGSPVLVWIHGMFLR
jgi:carboxylesterase type B